MEKKEKQLCKWKDDDIIKELMKQLPNSYST